MTISWQKRAENAEAALAKSEKERLEAARTVHDLNNRLARGEDAKTTIANLEARLQAVHVAKNSSEDNARRMLEKLVATEKRETQAVERMAALEEELADARDRIEALEAQLDDDTADPFAEEALTEVIKLAKRLRRQARGDE